VQTTRDEFLAQTATTTRVTETFDGYPVGPVGSPFRFVNGTVSGDGGFSIGQDTWCYANRCLHLGLHFDVRVTGLPPGSTHWGTHVIEACAIGDVHEYTVVGRGGVLVARVAPDGSPWSPDGHFVGFADAEGLVSITIRDLGQTGAGGGYCSRSLADVITAGVDPWPVPTLSGASLAALALLLLSLAMREHRDAADCRWSAVRQRNVGPASRGSHVP
jgi:hypothetical protein